MQVLRVALISAILSVLTFLGSLIAVYSYGRFAERTRGAPSGSLPISDNETVLDVDIAPRLADHPGQSGLMLLSSNLHAFATRALAARSAAGRKHLASLDGVHHGIFTDRIAAVTCRFAGASAAA